MQDRSSKPKKRPQDAKQLAKPIVDAAISEDVSKPPMTDDGKNAAAVALGRLGGLKGGKARAKKLSKAQRSEIAANAAKARWSQKKRGEHGA